MSRQRVRAPAVVYPCLCGVLKNNARTQAHHQSTCEVWRSRDKVEVMRSRALAARIRAGLDVSTMCVECRRVAPRHDPGCSHVVRAIDERGARALGSKGMLDAVIRAMAVRPRTPEWAAPVRRVLAYVRESPEFQTLILGLDCGHTVRRQLPVAITFCPECPKELVSPVALPDPADPV